MKMLDPKNVMSRSSGVMESHINMFEKYYGRYEKIGTDYFFGNDEQYVKIGYLIDNKLLFKTFSINVKVAIPSIIMKKSWNVKSRLVGTLSVEGIIFNGKSNDDKLVADALNSDPYLQAKLFDCIKKFDLEHITIKYNSAENRLTIDILPYAGAFLWVKLPPVYYNLKLKPHEIEAIYETSEILSNYFIENYAGNNEN